MTLSQIGMLILFMGIVPMMLGMLYTKFAREERDSLILNYCSGIIIMMALCELLAVPMIFMHTTLTVMLRIYGGVIAVLCVLSLILNVTFYGKMLISFFRRTAALPWQSWAAVLIIVLQTAVLAVGQHVDDDDSFYVGAAAAAVETDSMFEVDPYTGETYDELPSRYVLSPFPVFVAVIGAITGVHVTIIAHTIFPIIFIPFAYMIYAMLGRRLFGEKKEAVGYFLILAAAVYIFSGYSVYTQGTFLLIRVWQGKAVLAGALLPGVFYYGFRAYGKKHHALDYIMLGALMLSCCLVSSMGIMLGAVVLGLLAVVSAVRFWNGKIILYSFLCCIPNIVYSVIYLIIK
ncbi:DUF6077 domain-containing protein [Ruminococcus sp. OA3]|uniref:DUF6077 domain-containing protein n=1 Tax=Ruminococcus sp. OA3 TaxID=2914164 RepID=UPI001F066E70|nr:DUF6077 domain-containing protein [Ruminococcus sp. OA3]MCH1982164.1 DUF6077 domain-containing protein [Ruminococcus sp. OA3]